MQRNEQPGLVPDERRQSEGGKPVSPKNGPHSKCITTSDANSPHPPSGKEVVSASSSPAPIRKRKRRRRRKPKRPPAVSLDLVSHYIDEVYSEEARPEPQTETREYYLKGKVPSVELSKSAYEADWTSGESLLEFKDFPADRRDAFDFAVDKPEFHTEAFSPLSTFPRDIGILTMSDVDRIGPICYCHPYDPRHKTWRCGRPEFCQHCNYRRFRRELHRLAEAFDQHAGKGLYAITLSWSHPVALDDFGLASILWHMLEAAIREAHSEHFIEGAFFVRELAVKSFLPTRGFPHGHGLVSTEDDIQKVTLYLEDLICSSTAWDKLLSVKRLPADFRPNFESETPPTSGELRKWLFYTIKVFSVAEPYAEAFERIAPEDRWTLNEEVSSLMQLYDAEMIRDEQWVEVGKALYRNAGRILRLGQFHWGSATRMTTAKSDWKNDQHISLMEKLRLKSKGYHT